MATGANEQGEGKKSLSPQYKQRWRLIVAVRSGALTASTISCPTRGAESASQRPTTGAKIEATPRGLRSVRSFHN